MPDVLKALAVAAAVALVVSGAAEAIAAIVILIRAGRAAKAAIEAARVAKALEDASASGRVYEGVYKRVDDELLLMLKEAEVVIKP